MDKNNFKNILSCNFNSSHHRNFENLSQEIFESIPNPELFNVNIFFNKYNYNNIYLSKTGENKATFNRIK